MGNSDLRVLAALFRGLPRRGDHAARLQAFYGPQAQQYDRFRERLLHGRRELVASLIQQLPPSGGRLLELGGGTGRNLDYFGARLRAFDSVELVDLCPALLDQARQRAAALSNLAIIEADACHYQPPQLLDCVFLSYSLSMIPDWRAALANALAMLKPGGLLGVVDFYVSTERPSPDRAHHGLLTRRFWPRWFGHDGVRVGADTLPALCAALPEHQLQESRASVPYLPGLTVPYFIFVGHKPGD